MPMAEQARELGIQMASGWGSHGRCCQPASMLSPSLLKHQPKWRCWCRGLTATPIARRGSVGHRQDHHRPLRAHEGDPLPRASALPLLHHPLVRIRGQLNRFAAGGGGWHCEDPATDLQPGQGRRAHRVQGHRRRAVARAARAGTFGLLARARDQHLSHRSHLRAALRLLRAIPADYLPRARPVEAAATQPPDGRRRAIRLRHHALHLSAGPSPHPHERRGHGCRQTAHLWQHVRRGAQHRSGMYRYARQRRGHTAATDCAVVCF